MLLLLLVLLVGECVQGWGGEVVEMGWRWFLVVRGRGGGGGKEGRGMRLGVGLMIRRVFFGL